MFKISSPDFTSTWNLGTWRVSKEKEFKENVLLPKFINLSTCQAQEMISIGNLMQISVGIIFFHDPKACPWFMPYVSGIKILMSGHYNAGKLETKHHLITTTSSWNISRAHSMGGQDPEGNLPLYEPLRRFIISFLWKTQFCAIAKAVLVFSIS